MKTDYRPEIRANINALLRLGYKLLRVDYDNGHGTEEGVDAVTLGENQVDEAVDAIVAVDAAHLFVASPGAGVLWFFFVLGNESGVVVNDWATPNDEAAQVALDSALGEVSEKFT